MTPDLAILDRIVDDETAVLLLERDGETVDELTLETADLPVDGRHEGAVFELTVEEGTVVDLAYRPETESDRRERAQDRFDGLSKRLDEE